MGLMLMLMALAVFNDLVRRLLSGPLSRRI
jgi:hypothetical protein